MLFILTLVSPDSYERLAGEMLTEVGLSSSQILKRKETH